MDKGLQIKFVKYLLIGVFFYILISFSNKICDEYNLALSFSTRPLELILPIITALLLIEVTYSIGKRGIELQKHSVKIQLFDKRYKVFQSIIEANTLVSTKTQIVLDVYKSDLLDVFNNQLTERLNQLKESELISKKLLNEEICNKMKIIVSQFQKIHDDFFQLYKLTVRLQITLNSTEKLDILNMTRLTNDLLRKAKIKSKNQVDIMALNSEWEFWKESVNGFSSYIESSRILNDFDKYLIINDI